jgi:ubiquinone/menaquinone biosynthesis C-methylase UbiE
MSATELPIDSAPFDAVAARYDDTFTASRIGCAQRTAVWEDLAKAFRPGFRLLEIGCGTAVDACFLAQRGVRVVACDASPEMIAVAKRKIREKGVESLVQPLVMRAEELCTLRGELFDGAFSNFGPLNCVENLADFGRDMARVLKPGASALLCWMNPFCLWEIAWYLSQGNKDKAFRRSRRDTVTARVADGAYVQLHYPSASVVARTFAPQFQVKSIKAIGLTVPPSYVEAWALRHSRLIQVCVLADKLVARCPVLRGLGDHVLVRFVRTRKEIER